VAETDQDDIGWLRPRGGTHSHPAGDEWLTLPWALRDRVLKVRSQAKRRLGDIAEILVGVQTSADDVYLFETFTEVAGGTVDVVPRGAREPVRLERGILRQCVKGSGGGAYRIFFPYDDEGTLLPETELKRVYPRAWAYLLKNRSRLEGREKGSFEGKDWHRYGRQQGYGVVSRPKVLVPALLREPSAVVDSDGSIAFTASGKGGGGAWALVPKAGVTLDQLASVVNSETFWDHVRAFGSPQKGGWRGVDRDVLTHVPVVGDGTQ
jgi:adenine-specific DNA-methyltransferase